jgi:hypothetical protein
MKILKRKKEKMKKNKLTPIKSSLLNGLYSIGEGMASLFGYNTPIKIPSEQEGYEKDCESLRGDWEAVGKDLERAIKRFEEDN